MRCKHCENEIHDLSILCGRCNQETNIDLKSNETFIKAVKELCPSERLPFILRYFVGLSFQEISEFKYKDRLTSEEAVKWYKWHVGSCYYFAAFKIEAKLQRSDK